MGQFKPMVKMMTNEPSVILKLKKGGNVHSKMATGGMAGHKAMHCEPADFEAAEHGKAPKKPSMADRRKAMNPNQYAKGGKVAHKQMGGMMPGAMPSTMPNASPSGAMTPMSPTAMASMPAAARMARAAKIRRALTGMKKGGSTSAQVAKLEKELKHHEAMSASKAHGKASGGKIDSAETKTTLKNSVKPFVKTKVVDGDKHDKAHGTGEVKEGKPGGYKMGGTIEGNAGKFAKTKVVDGDKADRAHGTGGVRMSNAGGFAKGGNVDWENRPANTAKAGVDNTTTGEVKEANAGGYKRGGAAKKHYATGGNVIDDGKAVKMPRHFVSRPVANSLQSGTFKKGGKVKKYSDGDSVIDSETRRMQDEKATEKSENQAMRESILGAPKRMIEGVKNLFGSKPQVPAGSVTKTEKSVTVTPKRRGGRAMC
jgi:hypothetical protein